MSKKEKAAAKAEKQGSGKEKTGRKSGSVADGPLSPKPASSAKTASTPSASKSAESRFGLDERQITLISKALADPKRMAIFRTIARGRASCGSIKSCIDVSAATLSHHMKELEMAGLIETSREGRFMHAALQKKVWKSYLGELKSLGE